MGTSNQTIGDFRKVVAAAATAEALSASTLRATSAAITAEADNTGAVVVGGSSVIAALATRRGTPLYPGDTLILEDVDLGKVYIDSLVNGDGVTVSYQQ